MNGLVYFCIEGNRDQTFLEMIIKPKLIKNGYIVDFYQYAEKSNKRVQKFIKSVDSMDFAVFYFLSDFDEYPCYTKVKERHITKIENLTPERILVVNKMIESWILAGQTNEALTSMRIKFSDTLESIGKSEFERLKPKRFKSVKGFVLKLLEEYDLTCGIENSKSLKYFCQKINLI